MTRTIIKLDEPYSDEENCFLLLLLLRFSYHEVLYWKGEFTIHRKHYYKNENTNMTFKTRLATPQEKR